MTHDAGPDRPPLALTIIGKTLTYVIAKVPGAWPLLRRPTRRFWDRMARGWDRRASSPGRIAPLEAACELLPRAPERALELGTGTGAGALMLARRFPGARIDAVDLSQAMVEAAKRKAPESGHEIAFAVADAAALPFPDVTFDLVVQLNVPLYPVELARVLRPGGHVIVASSLGAATPYHTPERLLRRRFDSAGLTVVTSGAAGIGTFVLAERRA